jgi:stress response protein YsnF
MLSERELSAAIGSTAYGPDGQKIGTVEHFFTDDRTGAPTWVAVSTGLFGTRHSVVPAAEATFADGALQLPVTRDAVRSAPHVSDEHLDPDAEALLRRHYETVGAEGATPDARTPTDEGTTGEGATGDTPTGDTPTGETATGDTTAGGAAVIGGPGRDGGGAPGARRDEQTVPAVSVQPPGSAPGAMAGAAVAGSAPAPAPAAATPPAAETARGQDTEGAMTRSEEQLRVGTERVVTTRARLVKYVVTEQVTITVPIRREEIRVEQVPVDAPDPGPGESLAPDADRTPAAGAPAGDQGGLPEEIVLHAERPVVTVEVVPVERVRLRTDVVTGQQQVTEQVQREQIVVDQDRLR